MYTPRGFLFGPVVMLLSLAVLARPARGQVPAPAPMKTAPSAAPSTAPAVATSPPATQPARPTPPEQKVIDAAVQALEDRRSTPQMKAAACDALRRLGAVAGGASGGAPPAFWGGAPLPGAPPPAGRGAAAR